VDTLLACTRLNPPAHPPARPASRLIPLLLLLSNQPLPPSLPPNSSRRTRLALAAQKGPSTQTRLSLATQECPSRQTSLSVAAKGHTSRQTRLTRALKGNPSGPTHLTTRLTIRGVVRARRLSYCAYKVSSVRTSVHIRLLLTALACVIWVRAKEHVAPLALA
jgi:hypothetical protein